MRIMDAYLMDLPATVFTPRLVHVKVSFVSITLLKNLRQKTQAYILGTVC